MHFPLDVVSVIKFLNVCICLKYFSEENERERNRKTQIERDRDRETQALAKWHTKRMTIDLIRNTKDHTAEGNMIIT